MTDNNTEPVVILPAPDTEEDTVSAPAQADAFPDSEPMRRLDGQTLQKGFESALAWLEDHVSSINALNVFPVPDGDTGTNMLATLRSAIKQAEQGGQNAAETARNLANGAVRGARGNSGVILSQILNGFAKEMDGKDAYTAEDVAAAFKRASESAYNAVMKPVEGTILTVIRAVAEGAEAAARETSDIREQLRLAIQSGQEALNRTPEMLPILKEAGVVDSGGQGLVTILEGLSRYLHGKAQEISAHTSIAQTGPEFTPAFSVDMDPPPTPFPNGRYGYDIQFLIQVAEEESELLDVTAIREVINQMGDCPLVVGDERLVKVHVHALSPAPALDYGASLGMLDDVVVENMDLQYARLRQSSQAGAPTPAEPLAAASLSTESVAGLGIVTVVSGEGLADHFRALGASRIVSGGQSMNPSAEDLLDAIHAVQADSVILLPNNKNVILAANQARNLAQEQGEKAVYVVPTRSVPQGFAALMALDYSADAEANAEIMCEQMHDVVTIEVTTAVRTTNINGIQIHEGQQIGLLDGQILISAEEDLQVIQGILDQIDLSSYEVAMIYYGAERTTTQCQDLLESLAQRYPQMHFEMHPGGQPYYAYLISIE